MGHSFFVTYGSIFHLPACAFFQDFGRRISIYIFPIFPQPHPTFGSSGSPSSISTVSSPRQRFLCVHTEADSHHRLLIIIARRPLLSHKSGLIDYRAPTMPPPPVTPPHALVDVVQRRSAMVSGSSGTAPISPQTNLSFDAINEMTSTTANIFTEDPVFARLAREFDSVVEEATQEFHHRWIAPGTAITHARSEQFLLGYAGLVAEKRCLDVASPEELLTLETTPNDRAFWLALATFLVTRRSTKRVGKGTTSRHLVVKADPESLKAKTRSTVRGEVINTLAAFRRITGRRIDHDLREELMARSESLADDSQASGCKPTATWADVQRLIEQGVFGGGTGGGEKNALRGALGLEEQVWRIPQERTMAAAFITLLSFTGARPGEVVRGNHQTGFLTWGDIRFFVTLPPQDEQELLLSADVTLRHLKGKRNQVTEYRTQPLYSTPGMKPSVDCVKLLAALAEDAGIFDLDVSLPEAVRSSNRPFIREHGYLEIPLKEEKKDVPVLRTIQRERGLQGSRPTYSLSPDKPLDWQGGKLLLTKAAQLAGCEPITAYAFRRFVANTLFASPTVKETALQVTLGHHPGNDTFVRYYLSKRSVVDLQGLAMNGAESRDMIAAHNLRYSLPAELTASERLSIENDPEVVAARLTAEGKKGSPRQEVARNRLKTLRSRKTEALGKAVAAQQSAEATCEALRGAAVTQPADAHSVFREELLRILTEDSDVETLLVPPRDNETHVTPPSGIDPSGASAGGANSRPDVDGQDAAVAKQAQLPHANALARRVHEHFARLQKQQMERIQLPHLDSSPLLSIGSSLAATFETLGDRRGTRAGVLDMLASLGSCGCGQRLDASRSVDAVESARAHLDSCKQSTHRAMDGYRQASCDALANQRCPHRLCWPEDIRFASDLDTIFAHLKRHRINDQDRVSCVFVGDSGLPCHWQAPADARVRDASKALHEEEVHGIVRGSTWLSSRCSAHGLPLFGVAQIEGHYALHVEYAEANADGRWELWAARMCVFCLGDESLPAAARGLTYETLLDRNHHILRDHITLCVQDGGSAFLTCPKCEASVCGADMPQHLLARHGVCLARDQTTRSIGRDVSLLGFDRKRDTALIDAWRIWVESCPIPDDQGTHDHEQEHAAEEEEGWGGEEEEEEEEEEEQEEQEQEEEEEVEDDDDDDENFCDKAGDEEDAYEDGMVEEYDYEVHDEDHDHGYNEDNKGEPTNSAVRRNVSTGAVAATGSTKKRRRKNATKVGVCPFCSIDSALPRLVQEKVYRGDQKHAAHINPMHIFKDRATERTCPCCQAVYHAGALPSHLENHGFMLSGLAGVSLGDPPSNSLLYCHKLGKPNKDLWLRWLKAGAESGLFKPGRKVATPFQRHTSNFTGKQKAIEPSAEPPQSQLETSRDKAHKGATAKRTTKTTSSKLQFASTAGPQIKAKSSNLETNTASRTPASLNREALRRSCRSIFARSYQAECAELDLRRRGRDSRSSEEGEPEAGPSKRHRGV
ncbi:hypothetical protein IE53DRAFT_54431 [Violaceomyces palustris]|uniref:Uncharacterized protein n=1 Tax=Violaceomyces palustris TaxID=1673888 RepID=A0ACD0P7E9_9BASI|nr:hypothetical protein IE53DRAFT_54431 [Violaceomyces palustris]